MKPTVYYNVEKGVMMHPCGGLLLWPVNHPVTENVSGDTFVLTSNMIKMNQKDGTFETDNSIYLPHEETENG